MEVRFFLFYIILYNLQEYARVRRLKIWVSTILRELRLRVKCRAAIKSIWSSAAVARLRRCSACPSSVLSCASCYDEREPRARVRTSTRESGDGNAAELRMWEQQLLNTTVHRNAFQPAPPAPQQLVSLHPLQTLIAHLAPSIFKGRNPCRRLSFTRRPWFWGPSECVHYGVCYSLRQVQPQRT